MMMTAPITGEPKTVARAAKLPAAARTIPAWAGTARLDSRTANNASPVPRAISGDSGPSTRPSPIDANAARSTPGSSTGVVGGPVLRPSEGLWPPCPGSRAIAKAMITPATASTGTGHHHGTVLNPSPLGRSS
jgi:hypothetical protein